MTTQRAYGTWPSPISAEMTTRAGIRFGDVVRSDGDDVYWVESRPQEGGRSVIVRRTPAGTIDDVGPDDFNARTRVHEYGGAAYAVSDGIVFASRFDDQRLYRIDREGEVQPITPDPSVPAGQRFADLTIHGDRAVAVRETHGSPDDTNPINDLVLLDLTGEAAPRSIQSGRDFYSTPRFSPDGSRLAWLQWDHPNMPWDGTELWIGAVGPDGSLATAEQVAGGEAESIFQPAWAPDGTLRFVSDRTGWWNLYRWDGQSVVSMLAEEAEHGLPGWVFGMSRHAALADGRVALVTEDAQGESLVVLEGDEVRRVPHHFSAFGSSIAAVGSRVVAVGHRFDAPSAVVAIDIDSGETTVLRTPDGPDFPEGFAPTPEEVTFPTPDGPAHALFYPPTHPESSGLDGEAPPVIVAIHGGPTSRAARAFEPEIVFWTSRGIGVLDVDHGGSTGFGREYRNRLRGRWGEVDVRDCALAAAHLAEMGKADPRRLLIHGGSAGGFTTLMALATTDVFAAGAASYPVTELEALASDTHKFESRYLDRLVGPLPEAKAVYVERSPITHVDRITSPVLLLQGSEDRVVPPSQPRAMRDALRSRGVPVWYLEFPGEGHGFRSADARIRRLEAELWFFARVLGFDPADSLIPLPD